MYDELSKAVAELEEDDALSMVKDLSEKGVPTIEILAAMQAGMEEVGRRFGAKEYFLSELIMSADIFKEGIQSFG